MVMHLSAENWDRYHLRELEDSGTSGFTAVVWRAMDFCVHAELFRSLDEWLAQRPRRIWFPGCGLSIGPALFAVLGHNVLATDWSSVAIEHQQQALPVSSQLLGLMKKIELGPEPQKLAEWVIREARPRTGTASFAVHDFCSPLPHSGFDLVLNVRAFQDTPADRLPDASSVFWQALRPTGHAIFDTVNVSQPKRRDDMEEALRGAGFALTDEAVPHAEDGEGTQKTATIRYGFG
jgi:hypothetical protein